MRQTCKSMVIAQRIIYKAILCVGDDFKKHVSFVEIYSPFFVGKYTFFIFLMKRVNILSLITIVPNKWCSKFFKSIISSLVTHYSYMLVWVFENDTSTFVLNVGSEEYASSMFCKYFVRKL